MAGTADATVRPNQILAVGGLPLALLDGDRARRVVDAVERSLAVPLALRSLAPDAPAYVGRYEGDSSHRDGAYHQGTAWPWLLGPFVEAWVRVRGGGAAAKQQARQRFGGRTCPSASGAPCARTTAPTGTAWDYFPHDHARSRAYRWGEDGLLGISDRQRLCFALALWNGQDPILKERLFGLTGPEGNHGEDVKELYYYLDSTPTHSYMKALYKYPQAEFPYAGSSKRTPGAAGRTRSSSCSTPAFSTTTATSTCSSSTPRRPRTTCSSASRPRQPRARGGAAPPAADALVPQHLVVGPR